MSYERKEKNYNNHFTQSVYRFNRGETDINCASFKSFVFINHPYFLTFSQIMSQTSQKHLHSNISRIWLHICTVQIHFMQTQPSPLKFRLDYRCLTHGPNHLLMYRDAFYPTQSHSSSYVFYELANSDEFVQLN